MRSAISLGLLRDGYRTPDRMREERGGPLHPGDLPSLPPHGLETAGVPRAAGVLA